MAWARKVIILDEPTIHPGVRRGQPARDDHRTHRDSVARTRAPRRRYASDSAAFLGEGSALTPLIAFACLAVPLGLSLVSCRLDLGVVAHRANDIEIRLSSGLASLLLRACAAGVCGLVPAHHVSSDEDKGEAYAR